MNKEAFGVLTLKAVSEDKRQITGFASTITADRVSDVMVPKGAEFNLPVPFLWQHDMLSPVGNVTKATVTDEGIEVVVDMVKPVVGMPSQLVARLDEAWHSIKAGLVRGLSIGFRGLEYAFNDAGGLTFLRWDWFELSAVTVPCNADCNISSIKSFSEQARAASGKSEPAPANTVITKSAGAAANLPTVSLKDDNSMNIAELIKSYETKRGTLIADRNAVLEKSAAEGRTLDAEETNKYDGISAEIKSVDAHLERLREAQGVQASNATPVDGSKTALPAAAAPAVVNAPAVVHAPEKLEKGIGFARYAKALAMGNGSRLEAMEIAKQHYPEDKKLQHVIKAAVGAGSTTGTAWAAPLVPEYQEYANDFIEFLRPQTIIGRFGQGGIPALRNVPFNIRVPAQISGGSAGWVGEGKAKPLTSFDFESITFGHAKVAAIAVLTDELIRFSNPSADAMVRNSLAEAVIARLDTDFVNPAKAAGANGVSPASITNGITGHASTGDVETDIALAFGDFITANLQPTGAVWLMSASTALALSLRKNALGQREFAEMTMNGGTLAGLPVIVSAYVGNNLILVNAPDIYLADDGAVQIDLSREASLEMDSAPKGDSITPTGATEMVSMFQTNSVAIRAERVINWKRRRNAAVAIVTGVSYGANPTT